MEARPYCGIFIGVLLLLHGASSENEDSTEIDPDTLDDDPSALTTPPPSRLSNLLDYTSNANAVPSGSIEHSSISPYQVIERASRFLQKNGYDPLFLVDLEIQGRSVSPFREAGCSRVLLQDGRLFGMSDFRSVDYPSKTAGSGRPQQQQLWLTWKHLRVTFRVTIDVEGLKDAGDLDVRVGRLMMHVQPTTSSDGSPKVETSKVRRFESRLTGLDTASDDVRGAICREAETRLRTLLNGKVRHVLLTTVRRTVSEDSSDNELSPFRTPDRFYEVDF